MILYYALGGGLGHLTRSLSLINDLKLPLSSTILLRGASYAQTSHIPLEIKTLQVPKCLENDLPQYQNWLKEKLQEFHIQEVYLDAFPRGILGEWNFLNPSLRFFYIARFLKWKVYMPLIQDTSWKFTKTFVVEDVEESHQHFIQEQSQTWEPIQIHGSAPPISKESQALIKTWQSSERPNWLIVHAGSAEETENLWLFAQDCSKMEGGNPYFWVLSPFKNLSFASSSTRFIHLYPASPLFPYADRIISACGFNTMAQTKNFYQKHLFMPFPRKYDDQFRRARLRKSYIENLK